MNIESIPDQVWTDLILGNIRMEFEFLALKILLARLRREMGKDSSSANLRKCVAEIKGLFDKFGYLPSAQKDLAVIASFRSVS